MQKTREIVTLWFDDGTPARIVWNGRRYRVNDTPTRLDDELADWWHAAIAQPTITRPGWRFQARDDADDVRMFEVQPAAGDRWELLRVYE